MNSFRLLLSRTLVLLPILFSQITLSQWRHTSIDSTGTEWLPQVACDVNRALHVTFLDEDRLLYSTNVSGAWVKSTLDGSGGARIAAIAADRSGNVHVAYAKGMPLVTLSYIAKNGGTWSSPQTIAESLEGCVSLSIDVDSAGKAHVGFVEAATMAGSGPLKYATNASGSWAHETVGGSVIAYNSGRLAVTALGDVVFACYANGRANLITKPNGGSWSPPERIDTVATYAEGITLDIDLDGSGKPHVVYAGGTAADLRYATKPSSTWILETIQPGINSTVVRTIAVDASGFAHVSYVKSASGNVCYATNASSIWTSAELSIGGWFHDVAVDPDGYPHIILNPDGAIRHATTRPPSSTAFTKFRSGLPRVNYSSADWGDFDADGWMDIAITGSDTTGSPIAFVVHNREGRLVGLDLGLAGVYGGAAAWGDYDGDGDLDLVIAGMNSLNQPTANIYRNDSYLSFVNIQAGLTGFSNSGVAWGDYDSDGDLDLLITGSTGSPPLTNPRTKLYRNDKNGRFTEITTAGLPNAEYSSVAWGDYDKDGQPDILLTGAATAVVIKNFGSDVFMDMNMGLQGVRNGMARWGDYDGDGDLDILICGRIPGPSAITKIYRNITGAFVEASISLPGVGAGVVDWGDLDNDGAFDIVFAGESTTGIMTKVFRNNKDETFTEVPTSLPGVVYGSIDLGDYDRDGDLDVLVTGQDATFGKVADVYRNEMAPANTRPSRPTISLQVATFDGAQLYWNASTDGETTQNGLTYNIRVGTRPGGNDIVSAMSLPTGERTLPASGNVGHRRVFNLNGLTSGTRHYWSVQAVDQTYSASYFSAESSFVTPQPVYFTEVPISIPGSISGSVNWGDYDSDGDLDVLITGADSVRNVFSTIYQNDGSGLFSPVNSGSYGLGAGYEGQWGDYDRDSDLDILLRSPTEIYLKYAFFSYSPVGLLHTGNEATTWYDADNDGDLDPTSYHTATGSSPDVGDFDRDGRLDELGWSERLAGSYQVSFNIRLATETSRGIFLAHSFSQFMHTEAHFVDVDNDGYLDIHIATTASDRQIMLVLRQRSDGTSAIRDTIILTPVFGASAWGDFDNDGDPDLATTGLRDGLTYANGTIIQQNNGDGTFTALPPIADGLTHSAIAWGNFDNDNDLDLLMSGKDSTGRGVTRLFQNNQYRANWLPLPPTNLRALVNGTSVTLQWGPSTDRETPSSGLTYNLKVGTTSGGCDVVSPHSAVDGRRSIVARGNVDGNLEWTLRNLADGTMYYWSVQAIDHSFNGSVFSAEGTFQARPRLFNRSILAAVDFAPNCIVPGDYDADGDLDILVGSEGPYWHETQLLVCNSGGQYEISPISFGASYFHAGVWKDLDGDGDLDLLLAEDGGEGSRIRILRNEGGNSFTTLYTQAMDVPPNKMFWEDLDGDGDLDIVVARALRLLTGITEDLILLENTGGQYEIQHLSASGGLDCAVIDLDRDGDLDILGAGIEQEYYFENCGEMSFQVASSLYRKADWANISIADFDGDGWLDKVSSSTYFEDWGRHPSVYLGIGKPEGEFEHVPAGLPFSIQGIISADFDNDGDADIFLRGFKGNDYRLESHLFLNQGDHLFFDAGDLFATSNVGMANHAVGDFNTDGRMDFILGEGDTIIVYLSNVPVVNTIPSSPSLPIAQVSGTTAVLQWYGSSDSETPEDALTYNYRLSTVAGVWDHVSANALPNGRRQIVEDGNLGRDTSAILRNLKTNTTYFWSIQAIDGAFAGSAFSAERSFTTGTFSPSIVSVRDVPFDLGKRVTVTWSASILDTNLAALKSYSIWRSVPEGYLSTMGKKSNIAKAPFGLSMRKSSASGEDRVWEWMTTQEAHRLPLYSFTSPTLYDSSALGNARQYFLVSAHTDQPGAFYDSPVDSGQSVDNLVVSLPKAANKAATPYDPEIVSVTDIPRNEGGDVTLVWKGSPLDSAGHAISHYSIWRTYAPSGQEAWEKIAEQQAHHFSLYSLTTSTLFDSIQGTLATHRFLVSAHMANPNVFYDSDFGSGYSVDNLPPDAPSHLSGGSFANEVRLHWGPMRAEDVRTYLVYRSMLPGINPAFVEPFALANDTTYVDRTPLSGQTQYYRVFACDVHGNMSTGSNEIAVLASGVTCLSSDIPTEYGLAQNYPNPFNPSTTLEFDMPSDGQVVIHVFDVLGQHIQTLADEVLPAGRFRIAWNATGSPSGVYFCRMQSGTYAATRKLVLLK